MFVYSRRDFVKNASIAIAGHRSFFQGAAPASQIDLKGAVLVTSPNPSQREVTALTVLAEEAAKRCGLTWSRATSSKSTATITIYAGLASGLAKMGARTQAAAAAVNARTPEMYAIRSGVDGEGRWITIAGSDERGVLFGVGHFLRSVDFSRQAATVDLDRLPKISSPKYQLRGHQLGYRPKTNAYDAWTVEMWDQYIRDLAVFGTNAIELIPPRSDDLPDSPHFPIPPAQMMVEMSRIADSYGLDVWI